MTSYRGGVRYNAGLRVPADMAEEVGSLPLEPSAVDYAVPIDDTVALADSATPLKFTAHSSSPADSVVLADAVTIAWVQDRAGDGVSLTDQTIDAQGVRLGDTLALTDSAASAKTIPKSLTDSIVLADSLSRVSVNARAVADSIALTDNVTPDHVAAGSHEVDIDDTLVGTPYGEGEYGEFEYGGFGGLKDSVTRVVTAVRTPADSIELADAQARAFGKPVADTVSLTDSVTPVPVRNVYVNDAVLVEDNVQRVVGYTRTPADGLVLADATVDAQGLKVADLVALADAISRTRAKTLTDSVALTDLLSRISVSLRSVADAVALSDSITQEQSSAAVLNLSDAVAVSDVFSRIASVNRSVSDSVALTDALDAAKVLALALSSQIVFTDDVLNRVVTYVRTPADALVLQDQLTTSALGALGLADLVALTDDQVVALISLSTMLDEIYTGRIAYGTNGDNGNGEQGEISDTVAGVVEEELEEVLV